MTNIDTIREAIKDYRIASYEEQKYFEVCEDYELLIGPDGFECALTEPEDRTFYRDLSPVIFELNRLRKALAALSTIEADKKPKEPSDDAILEARMFAEEIASLYISWGVSDYYKKAAALITAHDDAIRRECANRAVSLLRLIRLSDEWGDLTNERMISAILGTEPAREES